MAIVGVGLIGGSIGLARARAEAGAPSRSASAGDKRSLDAARRLGAIDHRRDEPGARRGGGAADHRLHAGRHDCRARDSGGGGCPANRSLITDAGSTKARNRHDASSRCWPIAATGRGLSAAIRWPAIIARAPSMPGPICSTAARSSSRRPRQTRPAAVTEVSGFWQSLGADVVAMTPGRARRRRWR